MSSTNANMMRLFKGHWVDFIMQGDPHDEDEKRIRFCHYFKDIDGCNWHAVQEHAASILGKEFEYGDVILAAERGLSARIALEARLDTCPGGHGTAIAIQDGCRDCYKSLRFATPLEPDEPTFADEMHKAKKRRREFEDDYHTSRA